MSEPITESPRRPRWIAWLVAIALGIWLSVTMHGSATHFMLSLFCLAYVVVPWYLAGWAKRLWLPFVGRGTSAIPRGLRRNPGLIITSAIAVIVSFVPGCVLGRERESAATQWADGIVVAIESYHSAKGAWPATLGEVADIEHAPALVRDGHLHYQAREDGFGLDLWSEGDLIFPTGWSWDTSARYWHRYH